MFLTSSRRTVVNALAILLSASALVAGCSSGGGAAPASAGADVGGARAGATGVPAQAIARTTFPAVTTPGTIEVGLVSLARTGQLAVLTLSWSPHYQQDPGSGISLYDMFGRTSPSISLVDGKNLKRYVVVEDSQGHDLSPDVVYFKVANNSSGLASYTFAAPPAGARLAVYADARPLFTDVAVTG
ncbi:Lipoprotein [Frankia sp. AiPs1]|uniref:hypothetical protein n=1 Tax=Frankia sp. AiPa1 TaxID=573492 RepID=UPI00202B4C24|nr:hypothetical protein [Frankia sp. AiPa1]MCL9759328.1 hypothetical protein [Frankia sp. AiPa1]